MSSLAQLAEMFGQTAAPMGTPPVDPNKPELVGATPTPLWQRGVQDLVRGATKPFGVKQTALAGPTPVSQKPFAELGDPAAESSGAVPMGEGERLTPSEQLMGLRLSDLRTSTGIEAGLKLLYADDPFKNLPPMPAIPQLRQPGGATEQAYSSIQQAYGDIFGTKTAYDEARLEAAKQAEMDAAAELENMQLEFRYGGLSADQVKKYQGLGELAKLPESTAPEQARAAQAASTLRKARIETEMEPDPRRLWNQKSTGEKVALALLVGLAEAMAGIGKTGMQGKTLDMVQQMMDRDYQAQKDAYAQRRGRVADAQSAYSFVASRYTKEEEREAAAKMRMWEGVKMQLPIASAKDARIAAENEQMRWQATLQQQRYLGTLGPIVSMAGHRMAQAEALIKSGGGKELTGTQQTAATGAMQSMATMQYLRNMLEQVITERPFPQGFVPGVGGLYGAAKSLVPGTPEAQYIQMRGILSNTMARAIEGGRVTDKDREVVEKAFPGRWELPHFTGSRLLKQIDAAIEHFRRAAAASFVKDASQGFNVEPYFRGLDAALTTGQGERKEQIGIRTE